MTTAVTTELMSSIYGDILKAVGSWEVWKELTDQRNSQAVGHSEFFDSVHVSLLDAVVLAISRVLDKDRRTMSIPNLLKAEPKLSSGQVTEDITRLLCISKSPLDKIIQLRDQHIAHQDKAKQHPPTPLLLRELDQFLDQLVEQFQVLGSCLQCAEYEFVHRRDHARKQTTAVMRVLQADWKKRDPAHRW